MKFAIHTYGCQMNERDSESVAALLARHGWQRAATEDDADVLLVNTCSVRGKAEDKALGKLGLLAATKRERPGRLVGVMGCMAQRLGAAMLERVAGLDFVVGTRRLPAIPAIIDCVRAGRGPVLDIEEADGPAEPLPDHEEGRTSAFVNILFGCNRRCAYCIVPTVRGREWSRPAAQVLDEVRNLAAAGVKEVTLLGQSVTLYGRRNEVWPAGHRSPLDFTEPLPRLLEAVSAVPGIARVRFTSGHPEGCTPELVRAFGEVAAVCEHLHLPLQSGSDRILEKMRRGYTADGYRRAVAALRAAAPGMALTTDVIVGFPTESESEFEETRAFMAEMAFDNAFIFKYSPRPGTPAAAWKDDVSAGEKLRRNHVLLEDQEVRGLALNERRVGAVEEVLVEGVSLRNDRRWSGRTRTNKIALFEPRAGLREGDMAQVRIERAKPQTLYGSLV